MVPTMTLYNKFCKRKDKLVLFKKILSLLLLNIIIYHPGYIIIFSNNHGEPYLAPET